MSVELICFRLANYETPLWSVENFSAGRYNEPDAGFTQYLSLHPLTPWAELLRNEDRRTRERAVLMRYPLWAIRVLLEEEPFVLTFDNADEFGLTAEDLVADDHGPCRALAQAFRQNGPQAFPAPSAALPGTTNLVVLEPRVLAPWNQIPLDEVDWPGRMEWSRERKRIRSAPSPTLATRLNRARREQVRMSALYAAGRASSKALPAGIAAGRES